MKYMPSSKDLEKMRSMAWRVSRSVKDDRDEMAKDLYQTGWEAYLQVIEKDEGIRWTAARWAMYHAWKRWRFGIGQTELRNREYTEVLPLIENEKGEYPYPSHEHIENKAILSQLLRAYEKRIQKTTRTPEKYLKLLKVCIENDYPIKVPPDLMRRNGLTERDKEKRLQTMQHIFRELME